MKQHPDSVNRDIDDEVAGAIERRYAERLVKGVVGSGGPAESKPPPVPREPPSKGTAGDEDFDREIEQLRDKSGV
jgi:hypothetical protein